MSNVSLTINFNINGFISDVCQKIAVVEAIKGGVGRSKNKL